MNIIIVVITKKPSEYYNLRLQVRVFVQTSCFMPPQQIFEKELPILADSLTLALIII